MKIDSKIPFDLNLDISYTSFAISRYISDVTNFSNQVNETKEKLYEFSKSIKSEIEKTKTSVEAESHDITNVLSTMEKIDDAMSNIENNFSKVASTASNTLNHIQESSNLLELNIKQIEQITNANIDTISGIKDLSDQIESVWQVISTIDTITEKTRTIAFNAEIETSTLGETAENFHIVANEIRRLADSVTDSTLSIRNKITSIQHASDNLVITSEGGTEKIREESELFTTLEEKFEEIKLSAQVTDESTVLIKQFLDNQRNSLEELSKMLYSLNNNFENFRNCTTEVSSTNSQILNILKGDGNAE